MKYVYPKFSKYDLSFVRFGGAGLGNLLFIYSRALIYAKLNDCKFIWPTWPSIKIGTYIRKEKDKRFYGDLFRNNSGYVDGWQKVKLLTVGNKINERFKESASDNDIIVFDDFRMNFNGIKEYHELIKADIIKNLADKNKMALDFDFSNSISVHIRLGDFLPPSTENLKSGCNNTSIPISWYKNIIIQIRNIAEKDLDVYIFSDGTDEQLNEILSLPNVQRITFGTSIADIIALSNAKLFIASGSSFSMWARFLGNLSTITYTNQLKEHICDENGFEIECDESGIDEINFSLIKKIFNNEA